MVGYIKNARKRTWINKVADIVIMAVLPILFLLLWEKTVDAGILKATLLPPPTKLWSTFVGLVSSGKIQRGLIVSLKRVIIGFFIGSFTGIILGFLMGLFSTFNKALTVFVNILRPIPTIALIPIFIIVFGIGEVSNIGVIVVGAFWPALLNTLGGIQTVDNKLIELAYVYRIENTRTVFKIILPSAMTSILTGVRLGLGTAWMSVVAAEMIGASSGIGYMIMLARELAQPAYMYVEVLIIGLIGFLLDRLLLVVQNKVNLKYKGIAT